MSEVWTSLLDAHERIRDHERHGAPAHTPTAAVLACSDARVPPSVIFDQPAGSLFVVRIAGNTASPAAVASLDYAVAELGVDLVVVLGHTHCGAVGAAAAGLCDDYLQPITRPICGLVDGSDAVDGSGPADGSGPVDVDDLTRKNVAATMTTLAGSGSPVGQRIRSGAVELRGAVFDLGRDRVDPVPCTPDHEISLPETNQQIPLPETEKP